MSNVQDIGGKRDQSNNRQKNYGGTNYTEQNQKHVHFDNNASWREWPNTNNPFRRGQLQKECFSRKAIRTEDWSPKMGKVVAIKIQWRYT